ncbi:magnesium/cobalt transporter CorA [Desulfobotulus sp.]|jgi:magnesium transporter|uniref:magnesium/cobalt transporter CorA n=1 Tax=Desulfobotulus sp. TaxID=1940337 RepID=UPI002A35D968|nr:magnesium/cobalt transporter CorA [Desulfobotulus sp.]MDY0163346.1 magnesium/cobalt transporter CorA [Desulfobotulus sp.]
MGQRIIRKKKKKAGAAPGTLSYEGDLASGEKVQARVIVYSKETMREEAFAAFARKKEPASVAWVCVEGVHEVAVVESLGKIFSLHPLVLEDILNTNQRPKWEDYGEYLYIVLRMLDYNAQALQVESRQLSLILGPDFVVSLQEENKEVFAEVRKRLATHRRIRFMGADYLAYALMDAVVDHYFSLLEHLGDAVERLEEELISQPVPETLARIHHFRREVLLLRKAVWPLRELLSTLIRDESPLISQDTRIYLRDVHDHAIHVLDTVETLRDLLTGMLDLYLSSTSNRMNEIMKMLTLFATIFMPLTFIAGVYGMNFENMPELTWPWGYYAALLFMLGVGGGLYLYFRKKKWL